MTGKMKQKPNPQSQDQAKSNVTMPPQPVDSGRAEKVPTATQSEGSSLKPQFEPTPLISGWTPENLAQGLVWAEILGKPRSRGGGRRF